MDVPGSAGGDIVKEQLLGHSSAESHDDVLKHLGLGLEVFKILLRAHQRKAACHAARDDGDIVYRVDVRQIMSRDGVAGFVVSGEAARLLAHLAALLLRTHLHLEYGLVHVLHVDEAVAAAHCEQCRLVHKVFKIGARKAGSALGDGVEVDILRKLLVSGVDLQYRLAPADIGQADIYLTVKAAGTQQRVIKDIRSVRRRHDYDALVAAEAVHLNEQLVERLLALIVSAAETAASLAADSVDLIDEDDRRGDLLCLLKQVAHTACADADIEFDKVRARNRQELHTGFARDSLCKQGLTGSRRADEQHALGYARAHRGIGLGVLEEVDDLGQLFLLLVAARDIGKGLLVLLIAAEAGARLGELGDSARSAAGLVHHHVPQRHHADHDEHIGYHARPPRRDEAFVIVIFFKDAGLILALYDVLEVLIEHAEAVEVVLHFLGRCYGIARSDLKDNGAALGSERLHLFLSEEIDEVGIVLYLVGVLLPGHGEDHGHHYHDEQHVKSQIPGAVAVRFQVYVTSFLYDGEYDINAQEYISGLSTPIYGRLR